MHKHQTLWRRSVMLAAQIYTVTESPAGQSHELATQMRRCAVSVATRIAEGDRHRSRDERIRHLEVARSALCELETCLCIAVELRITAADELLATGIAELNRLLAAILLCLREHRERARTFEGASLPQP